MPSAADPASIDRVGLKEVASRAGVAVSTVSRVMTEHPDVSERTRKKVMAVVAELGYQPNMIGQMLRQGLTKTIGFMVSDISNPLFAQIVLGAEITLSEHGYSLLLTNSMSNPQHELRHLKLLEQRRVDGLLLSLTTESDESLLAELRNYGGPMVAIDRDIDATPPMSAAYSDHRSGMANAVKALYEAGHRDIVLLTGLADLHPGRERTNAAVDTSRQLGMSCRVEVANVRDGDGEQTALQVLRSRNRPTAVIVGNNQLLIGVLRAFEQLKLNLPRDVSLVTCDDVPLLNVFKPKIATIRRDPYLLGRRAAEILLEQLERKPNAVHNIQLPTYFDPGETIAILR